MIPFFAGAHGDKYLEFNPDRSSSLKEADVATPSQIFFAQNDFLGGFDFWLANTGSAGTATFSLLNEQGIVIATRTVTVPTIAITSSGTKFHVDLNSQLPVLANDKYSIRITTSMPELRLYYSDRVQVISHNAPFVSPYITGVAMLGSEEQYFSFKYALYETNETSAPIVSNIGWSVISETQMKISFNANEAVDYRIEYGPSGQGYIQSTNFLGDYEFCTEGISVCDIIIPVSSDTTYQYRLTVKDVWGNQSQTTGTFQSGQSQTPSVTPTPDAALLAISNLRIVEVTSNSVSVAWTTNKSANSFIVIRYSGNLSAGGISDPVFELEHFLEIGQLNSSFQYRAEVTSHDTDNNESMASISFQTLSGATPTPTPTQSPSPPIPPPTGGPSPSTTTSVSPTPQITTTSSPSPGGANTGIIQWNPPADGEPADGYRVDVFDKDGKLVKTVFVPSGSNQAEIPELTDGEYNVIVYENNGGVFKKIDKPVKLKVEDSLINRLLGFWWVLIPLVAGLGFILWRNFKNKTSQITKTPVS